MKEKQPQSVLKNEDTQVSFVEEKGKRIAFQGTTYPDTQTYEGAGLFINTFKRGVRVENLGEKEELVEREIQNCEFRLKVLNFLKTELYGKKLFTYTLEVFIQFFEDLSRLKKREERRREVEEEGDSLIRNTQPVESDDD